MIDKFDFYDVMSALVPGVLVVGLAGTLFPEWRAGLVFESSGAFVVIVLTALAVFVGQLLVAIGSMIEGALFWTWGGKPSNMALEDGLGDRYLPKSKAMRIKEKILVQCESGASPSSLFIKAMSIARGSENNLVERFNAIYAYHRTLVVLVMAAFAMVAFSRIDGLCRGISSLRFLVWLVGLGLVLVISWFRAKQRAFYFVREVLVTAEREIDKKVHEGDKL